MQFHLDRIAEESRTYPYLPHGDKHAACLNSLESLERRREEPRQRGNKYSDR